MRILYNSKKLQYKRPFGCLKQDEVCTLQIDIPKECSTKEVLLCIKTEKGFEMKVPFSRKEVSDTYERYHVEFSLFLKGLYFYYFIIKTEEGGFDLYKQGDDTNIGTGDLWQLTCYDKNYKSPGSAKGKIMYQIFPDRFAKTYPIHTEGKLPPFVLHEDTAEIPLYAPDQSGRILNHDFYGGTLRGISEKLPYLHALGVGMIYINPIFFAYSNHRYDTADYKKIDPLLGTETDFVNFCKEAHALDMQIILDGVFSHTGSNSKYFDKYNVFGNGACSSETSPYKSWYSFQKYPDLYTSWWGIDTLPCTNEMDASFMDYILYAEDSVIKHWMRCGADGFRLDVADELPDAFIRALKETMLTINPNAVLFGEVWEDASNKISYGKRREYLLGDALDGVMNYPFRHAILDFLLKRISGQNFADKIMTIAENYPKPMLDLAMNSLSTHDTRRILTECAGIGYDMAKEEKARFRLSGERKQNAKSLAMAAAVLQFTLPGTPCIYYGDEIGMEGFEDPFNRMFFTWDSMDTEMLDFYKKLADLRNANPCLAEGRIMFEECGEKDIRFIRFLGEDTIKVKVSWDAKMPITRNCPLAFSTPYISAAVYI